MPSASFNDNDKDRQHKIPTTPLERIITAALFFATVIIITLILAR